MYSPVLWTNGSVVLSVHFIEYSWACFVSKNGSYFKGDSKTLRWGRVVSCFLWLRMTPLENEPCGRPWPFANGFQLCWCTCRGNATADLPFATKKRGEKCLFVVTKGILLIPVIRVNRLLRQHVSNYTTNVTCLLQFHIVLCTNIKVGH